MPRFFKFGAARVFLPLIFILAIGSGFVSGRPAGLKSLYEGHHWFQLRDAISASKAPQLYQGAVAAAFGQQREAEEFLQRAISSAPASAEAAAARDLLIHIYMRTGQYSKAASAVKEKIAARAGKSASEDDKVMVALISQMPDMAVVARAPSTLHYELSGANLSVPLAINGKPANFVMDSDANMSAISESEAKRLGMLILNGSVTVVGETGGTTGGGRIAVAKDLVMGNFHFNNVAFFVQGDDHEPFVELPAGKRGIIGIPVILALDTLRWRRDGTLDIGFAPQAKNLARANICFDNEEPVTQVEFQKHKLEFVMDTGAEESELWPPFAKEFASLLSRSGKKDSKTLTGFEGGENFDVVTLPEISFMLGGFSDVLRPAPVLTKPTVALSKQYYGRAGMDLLNQAGTATIDFHAMMLSLDAK
jgi:predicted aspartyl protease